MFTISTARQLKTSYDLCLPFQLPGNSKRNEFLDEILSRFLDPSYLANARIVAETKYPEVLYKDPESSLYIYVEGDNVDAHMPGIVPDQTGSPKSYVECVLKEAADAKKCSNDLKHHHPNLLAVNFVLSDDFQLAEILSYRVQSPTLPQIDPNIDALAVSTVGINERLTRNKLKVIIHSESASCGSLERIANHTHSAS